LAQSAVALADCYYSMLFGYYCGKYYHIYMVWNYKLLFRLCKLRSYEELEGESGGVVLDLRAYLIYIRLSVVESLRGAVLLDVFPQRAVGRIVQPDNHGHFELMGGVDVALGHELAMVGLADSSRIAIGHMAASAGLDSRAPKTMVVAAAGLGRGRARDCFINRRAALSHT